MKIFGSITELVSLILRKGTQAITVKPNQTVTYTADRDVQLPPQDANAVLVSESASQTLTNKTLTSPAISSPTGLVKGDVGLGNVDNTSDATKNSASVTLTNKTISAASNTLTNIANASISASAAIDATKIADGSVTSAEFQYINSVTSNVQTQLDAKVVKNSPITGATNTKITYDASGLVTAGASLAASDLPTGIDAAKINTGVVSNTEFNYLDGVTSAIQTQLGNKAATGANSDITSLSGLTTALSIGQGGTGQITANAAVNALLPSQTSAVNRFLRTDGSNTSWASAGGGVGKNYLQDQYDADASISVQQSVGNTLASSTRLNPTYFGSSDASLPLISVSVDGTLRPLNNYLIAFTTNAQFIETPLFSLDGIDLGKAMAVSFAVTGVGAADDVQTYMARYNSSNVLQERIPIAGIASATTPNSAQVPTGTTNFRGFFIPSSTAGDKYALRVLRNATNTSMRIDALVVGPSSIQTGTAITDWQSYTPTTTGLTTSSVLGKYRRVGDSINVVIKVVASASSAKATFSLPSGLSIDTAKQNDSTTAYHQDILGVASLFLATANTYNTGTVRYNSATTVQCFQIADGANTARQDFWGNTVPGSWATGGTLELEFIVPVIGFSSNITMADRAVEEYASNSTWDTDTAATTAFVNGSGGSQMGGALTSNRIKQVRFNTPILSTDTLVLEISSNANRNLWFKMGARVNTTGLETQEYAIQNTLGYGGTTELSSSSLPSTDCQVRFGRYATSTGATYGAAGQDWQSGIYWRVRKISGGAAVGYPIGARNVVGDTTGTAVPAGYIGERISSQFSAVSVSIVGFTTVTSVVLTPGIWDLSYNIYGPATATATNFFAGIATATNSNTGWATNDNQTATTISATVDTSVCLSSYRVTTSSPLTLYLTATARGAAILFSGRFTAVRVA